MNPAAYHPVGACCSGLLPSLSSNYSATMCAIWRTVCAEGLVEVVALSLSSMQEHGAQQVTVPSYTSCKLHSCTAQTKDG